MSTVTDVRPPTGRTTELLLLLFAVAIVLVAYANVGLATSGTLPVDLVAHGVGFLVISVAFHLVIRYRAKYADPLLVPIATLLNGLGLVMIHRIDIGTGSSAATRQLLWTGVSIAFAAAVLWLVHDHRVLRRYTFTRWRSASCSCCCRCCRSSAWRSTAPGCGSRSRASPSSPVRSPRSPGRVLRRLPGADPRRAVPGRTRVLGLQLPRGPRPRPDPGRVGTVSVLILVAQRDLGSSLLFFGLFVAMLYLATERTAG